MIRRILIPIGNSGSLGADLLYAVRLTEKFSARLTILQTYPIPPDVSSVGLDAGAGMATAAAGYDPELEMDKIKEKTEEQLSKEIPEIHKIEYELLILPGIAFNIIEEQQQELEPDLIVVGQTELTELETIFGSKPEEVSRKSSCPTIIIPDDYTYKPISKIGLAMDYENDKLEIPSKDILLNFKQKYNASLDIFSNIDEDDKEARKIKKDVSLSIKEEFSSDQVKDFTFHTPSYNSTKEGAQEFIAQNEIDLLILIFRKHGFFSRIFSPGLRKQMIAESELPLLILK